MKIKKILSFVMAASILTAMVTGCGGSASSAPSASAAPGSEAASSTPAPAKKKLVIGTTAILAKWTETSDKPDVNAGLQGYDIDLMTEIAARNGYEIEWKIGDFAALLGMLDTGEIDTIANETTINKDRMEKYDYTDTYAYDGYVFVVPKDTNVTDKTYFTGKKVCVQVSTNPGLALEAMNDEEKLGIEIVYLDDSQTALLYAVNNGSYDGAFMIKTSASIGTTDLGMPLEQYDPLYKTLPIVYLFRKDVPKNDETVKEINATLAAMKSDGKLSELSNKWFGQDVTVEPK